jgi:eukaryotic-like serine/threonine-protein kinase
LLLYESFGPRMKNDLWVLPMAGGGKPVVFLSTPFNERQGRFSPDGKWVAYTSDESGQDEVYIRSFAMNAEGTAVEASAKWPVSKGYGVDPHWRKDGRELYYRSRSGGIMAVGIETKPAFRAGQPETLKVSTSPFVNSVGGPSWEAAADGSRFLLLAPPSVLPPYTVVVNWQNGLKK